MFLRLAVVAPMRWSSWINEGELHELCASRPARTRAAQDALVAHLKAVTPWHVKLEMHEDEPGAPFAADPSGPACAAMQAAM